VLNAHILKLEAYLESAVKHSPVSYVLEFCTHHGVAFAWFDVLEINANPHLVIKPDASSLFNFL